MTGTLKIVAFSDTHGRRPWFKIPDGDVLVFAGDMTLHGRLDEVAKFNAFLGSLPHHHKLVIAGNHDACFESQPQESRTALTNAIYLQDEFTLIEGVKFYGSSWQPEFRNMAFNLPRGEALQAKWNLIPADTDILITHTPPWGQNDKTFLGSAVGCRELSETVKRLKIPRHIFGHIHEAHGRSASAETLFANVSVCNLLYLPIRRAFVFGFPRKVDDKIES
ncbi:MAG: metallophosphatase domain-containing protein [Chloroflexota bacterium]